MTKSELKKEFKKYRRENKTKSYILNLIGTIGALIGAVMVISVIVMSSMGEIDLYTHITYIIPGLVVVIVAMIIDVVGEIYKSKEYKEFSNKQQ